MAIQLTQSQIIEMQTKKIGAICPCFFVEIEVSKKPYFLDTLTLSNFKNIRQNSLACYMVRILC